MVVVSSWADFLRESKQIRTAYAREAHNQLNAGAGRTTWRQTGIGGDIEYCSIARATCEKTRGSNCRHQKA
eukprot:2528864-Pleurochrysis_carterae.AAC.2